MAAETIAGPEVRATVTADNHIKERRNAISTWLMKWGFGGAAAGGGLVGAGILTAGVASALLPASLILGGGAALGIGVTLGVVGVVKRIVDSFRK